MPEWGGDWTREARARWATDVADGAAVCGICRRPIGPGQSWDIDHITPIAQGGDMRDPANQRPAHSSCNRSRGAVLGNQSPKRQQQPRRPKPATGQFRDRAGEPTEPYMWTNPDFAAWVASWRSVTHTDT